MKTRTAILLSTAVIAGFIVYTFINTGQIFRVSGAIEVWYSVITKDMPLIGGVMRWLPLLAGLMLAAAQFVPEMTNKRLKLTMHLPLPEGRIVASMLAYGTAALLFVFIVTYAVFISGFSFYYPREMISGAILMSLPWFMAGLCGYFLAAWICFEPSWRHRIFNALAGVSFLAFFFIGANSGAYAPMLPWLAVLTAVSFTFPFYSAARFKDGAQ